MFGFNKKAPTPKLRRLYIPEEHIEHILELYDVATAALKTNSFRAPRWRFWKAIGAVLPATEEPDTYWTFKAGDNTTRPYVQERVKDASDKD